MGDQTLQNHDRLKKSFERDGFVHLPEFVTPGEMEKVETQMEEIIRDVVPNLSKQDAMYEDYDLPETLKQLNIPAESAPYFSGLRENPRFKDLARHLLQDDVCHKGPEYFCKPQVVGKPTPPHQDGYYFCLDPCEALTIWIALDDMDDENGALHYVAGSHKRGVLPHDASHVLGFSQGITEDDLSTFGKYAVCRVERGDVLIHHCLTIHAAPGNTSSRLRRAVAFVYYANRAKVDPEQQRAYTESLNRQRKEAGSN